MKRYFITCILILACTLASSQDLIVKKDGKTIKAYRIETTEKSMYYQLADRDDVQTFKVNIADILLVRKADGTIEDYSNPSISNTSVKEKPVSKSVDMSKFSGLALSRGNCVYIDSANNTSYEEAAVEIMKEIITNNGLWNVVDDYRQAHFVIQYFVSTKGEDKAFIVLRTRAGYENFKELHKYEDYQVCEPGAVVYYCTGSSESIDGNKSIVTNQVPKMLSDISYKLENSPHAWPFPIFYNE